MFRPSLPLLLIATWALACQQSPATAPNTVAPRSDAPAPSVQSRSLGGAADGGTAGSAPAAAARPGKALETFAGFSPDETRFAYAVYGENAGAYIFKAFRLSDGTLLANEPIEGQGTQKVRQLLAEGRYTPLPRAATSHSVAIQGGDVVVSEGGREVGRAQVLGSGPVPDKPVQASVWAKSPSGKYLVVELVADFGQEFGKARMFSLVPLRQAGDGK